MNYLLFGGAPDSGKTNAVLRLANVLQAPPFSMTISAGQMPRLKTASLHPAYMADEDFMVILDGSDAEGKPIRVALNSKSDDNASIDDFKAFLAKEPPVDVIVSSVRNLYAVRQYLFATMPVTAGDYYCEIPLAKFRQSSDWNQATDWYTTGSGPSCFANFEKRPVRSLKPDVKLSENRITPSSYLGTNFGLPT